MSNFVNTIPHSLSADKISEILRNDYPEKYFIGGEVNQIDKTVILYRGNMEKVIVPFDWFTPSGNGCSPDFTDFEVIDWGNTIRLGKYEAGADTIIHDFINPEGLMGKSS